MKGLNYSHDNVALLNVVKKYVYLNHGTTDTRDVSGRRYQLLTQGPRYVYTGEVYESH